MDRYDANGKKLVDDFEWHEYTSRYYGAEMKAAEERGETFLIKDSYLQDGEIVFQDNVHSHIMRLLSHINIVRPKSVVEFGCGGGHNIYNVSKLFPEIGVHGFDLLESQIKQMSEHLGIQDWVRPRTTACDLSVPFEALPATADYVYTNAVLMHLAYDKALAVIKNMSLLAQKYIRITEDLGQHDFMKLFDEAGLFDFDKWALVENNNCVIVLEKHA